MFCMLVNSTELGKLGNIVMVIHNVVGEARFSDKPGVRCCPISLYRFVKAAERWAQVLHFQTRSDGR